jgi:hypothetical protein
MKNHSRMTTGQEPIAIAATRLGQRGPLPSTGREDAFKFTPSETTVERLG